jgi:alpha-glucosidase
MGIYDQYLDINFPIDVMWNDYDYMDNYYSLLLDPVRYPTSVVSEWVNTMHQSGHRYVCMCV